MLKFFVTPTEEIPEHFRTGMMKTKEEPHIFNVYITPLCYSLINLFWFQALTRSYMANDILQFKMLTQRVCQNSF